MDYRVQVSTIHDVQNDSSHALPNKVNELELAELCTQMAGDDGVVQHHTTDQYHNIVSLFTGAEAVNWLLQQGVCNSAKQAEGLCDRMLDGGQMRPYQQKSSRPHFLNSSSAQYKWNPVLLEDSSDEDGQEYMMVGSGSMSYASSEDDQVFATPAPANRDYMRADGIDPDTVTPEKVTCVPPAASVQGVLRHRLPDASTDKTKSNRVKKQPRRRRLKWDFKSIEFGMTHHPSCYERVAWFDMDGALDEWEEEEDDERRRQLESRWSHFEYGFPPGVKCRERVRYEQDTAKLALLTRRAQERAKRTKQDVTQELLAYLHAADRLYNDILAGVLMLEGPSEMATSSDDKPPKAAAPSSSAVAANKPTDDAASALSKPQAAPESNTLNKTPSQDPSPLVATAVIAPSVTSTASSVLPLSAVPLTADTTHPRSRASSGKSLGQSFDILNSDDGLGHDAAPSPTTPATIKAELAASTSTSSVSDSGMEASQSPVLTSSAAVPVLLLAGTTTTESKSEPSSTLPLNDATVTATNTEPTPTTATHPRGAARRVSQDYTGSALLPRVEPLVAQRAKTFESGTSCADNLSQPGSEGLNAYQKIQQRLAEREAQRKLEQQREREEREAAIQKEIELKRQALQKNTRSSQDKSREGKEPRLSFLRRSLRRLSTNSDSSDGSRGSRRSQRQAAKAKAKADKRNGGARKSRLSATSEDIEYDNLREDAAAVEAEVADTKGKARGGKLGDLIRMFESNKGDGSARSSGRRSIKKMFRRSKKGRDQPASPSISEEPALAEVDDEDEDADVVPLPARASISLASGVAPVPARLGQPSPGLSESSAGKLEPVAMGVSTLPNQSTNTPLSTVTTRRATGPSASRDTVLASKLKRASMQADEAPVVQAKTIAPAAAPATTASQAPPPLPARVAPSATASTSTYSPQYLRSTPQALLRNQGIDPTRKEAYLSPEDFLDVFNVTKEEFLKFPTWRQQQRKKLVRLF
eukprot:m.134794 g.134794  ORF g.134794 m.134794 type:complete len:985 (-) comp15980_c0_seq2:144-3098(-)